MVNEKVYKIDMGDSISSPWIVSMNPGDLLVARCFNFSKFFGEKY